MAESKKTNQVPALLLTGTLLVTAIGLAYALRRRPKGIPTRASEAGGGGISPSATTDMERARTEPSVPVLTPSPPVSTPSFPVSTPSLPVSTPSFPVSTPSLPVSTPSLPVSTPSLPVFTPTTSSVSTPSLPVPTPPTSSVSTPSPVSSPASPSSPVSRGTENILVPPPVRRSPPPVLVPIEPALEWTLEPVRADSPSFVAKPGLTYFIASRDPGIATRLGSAGMTLTKVFDAPPGPSYPSDGLGSAVRLLASLASSESKRVQLPPATKVWRGSPSA